MVGVLKKRGSLWANKPLPRRTRFLMVASAALLGTYGVMTWRTQHFDDMTPAIDPTLSSPSSLVAVSDGVDRDQGELKMQLEVLRVEYDELKRKQDALLQALAEVATGEDLANTLDSFLAKATTTSSTKGHLRMDKTTGVAKSQPTTVDNTNSPPASASTSSPSDQEDGKKKLLVLQHMQSKWFIEVEDNSWLSVNADDSTPMTRQAFEVSEEDDGTTTLKSLFTGKYVRLVPTSDNPAWVYIADGTSITDSHKFELREGEGYIYNAAMGANMNVIDDSGGAVRGHGNNPRKGQAALDEPTARFDFKWVTQADLDANKKELDKRKRLERVTDDEYIQQIKDLPPSTEKRVISYGLYGSNPKYTKGAIRNAQLVDIYFPGWVARFYYDDTVPSDVIKDLKDEGAEVVKVEGMKGGIAGMFWRFLVADDPDVDRYVVRDTDSRLNARERLAIEDWIQSNKSVHSIRDHINHCRPLNGGLWGGVKGGVKDMTGKVQKWGEKKSYGADLDFLNKVVWPEIKDDQISHDAYCCEQFPNAQPFPTKRYTNYQHVGQVFDEEDNPRAADIKGHIRGVIISPQCRKHPDWLFG